MLRDDSFVIIYFTIKIELIELAYITYTKWYYKYYK